MDINAGASRRSRLLNGAASLIGFAHLAGIASPVAAAEPERVEPQIAVLPAGTQPPAPEAANRHPDGKFKKTDDDDEPDDDDEEGDDDGDECECRGARGRRVQAARGRERARCAAIFAVPEAAHNPQLAAHLAFETSIARTVAVGLLARGGRTAGGGGLRAAMATQTPTRVGGGAERTNAEAPAARDASWDRAMERHQDRPARRR